MEDSLEHRLERILSRYGSLLTKLGGVSCYEGKYKLSERAEKTRMHMIRCFVNNGILSYDRSGNFEVRYFHTLRFDTDILLGEEGRPLYPTKISYARKLVNFIDRYICPGSKKDLTFPEA